MARPERNNVDYFPHPVTHGRKMYYLDTKYGNDGYSVWFRTLEELGEADYHYMDLKDESQLMYLSSICKVTEDLYKEIIEVLVKFEEFDKELWYEHQILWNQKFTDSIKDAYKRRSNECMTKSKLYTLLGLTSTKTPKTPTETPKKSQKDSKNPQRIGKDRKEEDSVSLMSDLEGQTDLDEYELIAFSFWKLIGANMAQYRINSSDVAKAKYNTWVDPVRLAIQRDNRTKEEFQEIFRFLQHEVPTGGFAWSKNILSTGKLRQNFEKVLLKSRSGTAQQSNRTAELINELLNE